MKQTILKYFLFGMTLVSGFFSWFMLRHVLEFSGISAWLFPTLCFSAYVISLSLMAIFVRQEIAFEFVVIFSLLFSLIFVFSKWHFIVLVLCTLLMLTAMRAIRKDLDLNIKIDLWKSLYTGKFRMILALAVIICSQYFFMMNSGNGQKFIPRLDTAPITSKFVEPVLVMINPNFKTIKEESITVDQFIIIKSKQENTEDVLLGMNFDSEIEKQISENLPSEQREALKQEARKQISSSTENLSKKNQELVLQEGRKQLSQMVGYKISGTEEISDVFAGFIDKKINDYFRPRVDGDERSNLFSYLVAAILFLTIWPIGSVLCVVWFFLVFIIFKIMVYFGLVEIKTITVEREMIV